MPLISGMYYFENGGQWERPAVVLLHGAGGNNLSWPAEIRRLSDQRIYALDLPGHGKSEGIGRQSVPDYARCVLDFLDAMKIRRAIFVGHSMGGAIALWLGIHNPSRVLGLGLLSTGPRLRVSPALLSNAAVDATQAIAVKMTVDMSFGPAADPRIKELTGQRMNEIRYPVLYGDFLACDTFDETSLLGRAGRSPVLLMCGTDDRMTPLRYSQMMQERIKKSILHVIQGAGHMLMLEQPQAVANTLNLFLNGITYQPGS